jgi:hypothetical protein
MYISIFSVGLEWFFKQLLKMKVFILSMLALIGAGSISAQTYQELSRFEIGINGGLSRISIPQGSLYQGTSTYWKPYAAFKALYTVREYFQVGLDVNASRWESTDDNVPLTGLQNNPLGYDTVRYVFARPAISFIFQANALIPLFRNYRYHNVANIHLGIGGGPVVTVNDGATGIKRYGSTTQDSSYSYMNYYGFQPGSGWAFGFQAGYTHYIKDHVGFGIEYAPRYYHIRTNDSHIARRNSEFSLWAHALSLSVRYRW